MDYIVLNLILAYARQAWLTHPSRMSLKATLKHDTYTHTYLDNKATNDMQQ